MIDADLLRRARGCLLGLTCGGAVGTTLEFQPRDAFEPLTDMVGGGGDRRMGRAADRRLRIPGLQTVSRAGR